jgi:hypothetical protein
MDGRDANKSGYTPDGIFERECATAETNGNFEDGRGLPRIDTLAAAVATTTENVIRLGEAIESLGSTVKELLGRLRELTEHMPPKNLR